MYKRKSVSNIIATKNNEGFHTDQHKKRKWVILYPSRTSKYRFYLFFTGVKFGLQRKGCLQLPKDKNITFKTFWIINLQLGKIN